MLLSNVVEKINEAPRYTAGISFSERSIRYIEVERVTGGTLTLSSYGHLTVPFDVMKGSKIIKEVEFAELVKKLTSYIHTDARLVIRDDGDEAKIQSLVVAGFKEVRVKKGIDALRGIFSPWGAETARVGVFANYDTSHVLLIDKDGISSLGVFGPQELFSVSTAGLIREALNKCTNKEILLAGKYMDESFVSQLESYDFSIKRTNIWQNLFDFSRYVPEVPQLDSYEYTVPAGLVTSGVMEDLELAGFSTGSISKKQKKAESKIKNETTTKEFSKVANSKEDFFKDLTPLTKLDEDKRKASEKNLSRKHKKLLKKLS